ncbi:MAG: hypothetical protein ABSA33_07085 [Candidatus Micrarchaeaceae archaeon]
MLLSAISSAAIATDYSVAIVNPGAGSLRGGSAVNLYAVKDGKLHLVQEYVLQQKDFTGNLAEPLELAVNPKHDFVYVVYTGQSVPNIVGFRITPSGLDREWEQEIQTGDSSLQGTTITAGESYVQENTYPIGSLLVNIVSQTGAQLLKDNYADYGLISGWVDPSETLYYSCRNNTTFTSPASSVSVFKLGEGVITYSATPVLTSTDPIFIESICN